MRVVHASDGDGTAAAAAAGGASSREGVSSVEVYGFVGWITSSVAYGERAAGRGAELASWGFDCQRRVCPAGRSAP